MSKPSAPTLEQLKAWIERQPTTLIGRAWNTKDPDDVNSLANWLHTVNTQATSQP